jgi:hypothetical protein
MSPEALLRARVLGAQGQGVLFNLFILSGRDDMMGSVHRANFLSIHFKGTMAMNVAHSIIGIVVELLLSGIGLAEPAEVEKFVKAALTSADDDDYFQVEDV